VHNETFAKLLSLINHPRIPLQDANRIKLSLLRVRTIMPCHPLASDALMR